MIFFACLQQLVISGHTGASYIPYGTRLLSKATAESQLHNVRLSPSKEASNSSQKQQKFVNLKRAQVNSYQPQLPTSSSTFSPLSSHYEVDLPLANVSLTSSSSSSSSASNLAETNEFLPEITALNKSSTHLTGNAFVISNHQSNSSNDSGKAFVSSLENPLASPSETVDTKSDHQPFIYSSPLYKSDYQSLQPILLNIASRQHPGNVDAAGNRRPFMVESSNIQHYFHSHFPPLTAALPMSFFNGEGGHYSDLGGATGTSGHTPATLVNSYSADVSVDEESFNHLTGPVELAAVEQPSRETISAANHGFEPINNRPTEYVPGIPGRSWKDYPMFAEVPKTSFSCAQTSYGYYADVESGCQAWLVHFCYFLKI